MREYLKDFGTTGEMMIQDKTTDPEEGVVDFWVRSSTPIASPQFPWNYEIVVRPFGSSKYFTIRSGWKSFNFLETTDWQNLELVYVGFPIVSITLTIGDTGTAELGSGDILTGFPSPDENMVWINVNGTYVKAYPYVNVNDVWRIATPWVKMPTGWRKTT